MIRDNPRMGDPRLLERVARGRALRHAGARTSCSPTCATRWRRTTAPGLAAPQIGVPLRVVIFGVERNPRYPDAEPVPYTELVNPVLTPLDRRGRRTAGKGACRCPDSAASCRATRGCATRASIRAAGAIAREVDGFHARVVQHESDHLDGILYPKRIRDMRKFGFTDVLFPEHGGVDDD